MLFAAAADPWRWQPHPEVWLLVGCVVGLGVYVARVIAPKAEEHVTRRQIVWFFLGVGLLWAASDWPTHDIAEGSLYSVHMMQHFVLTFVMPPVFWLATPTWLAELVMSPDQPGWSSMKRLAHPVVTTVIFNTTVIFTHWPMIVNASITGPAAVHYSVHLLIVSAAFLMWIPVCGPWPQLRLSDPGKMVYLFIQSIVPTVPGAWLTMADSPVYTAYDHEPRLWGISVIEDQTNAGLIMKVLGGAWLWGIIVCIFFRWAARLERAGDRRVLTEEEMAALEIAPPTKTTPR